MLGRPGHGIIAGCRSQIKGQEVIRDGRPPGEPHAARSTINTGDFGSNQRGVRKPAQPVEVDMHLVPRIMPGNVAGQHARIRA